MEQEQTMHAIMSRRLLNQMTSLMPTLEGLLLITVLDGKRGHLVFRFHASVTDEFEKLTHFLKSRYPSEFSLKPENATLSQNK